MKKHLEIYKCRKERAKILFQDERRSTPKYTIFDYIDDIRHKRNW